MKLLYSLYIVALLYRHHDVYCEETHKTYRITDQVYSCSNWLSKIIDKFCNNDYKIVKRDTSIIMEKLLPKDSREYLNNQRLLAEERWRRVRRQVASECCDRPCTVASIIMYCPDSSKLLTENPDIFD